MQPDTGADEALAVAHQALGVLVLEGGNAHPGQGAGLPAVPDHEGPHHAPGIDRVGPGRLGPPHDLKTGWVAHHDGDVRSLLVQPVRQPEPFVADFTGHQDPVCCRVLGLADPGNQARRVARPQRVDADRVGRVGTADPDHPALGADLDSDIPGPGRGPGR